MKRIVTLAYGKSLVQPPEHERKRKVDSQRQSESNHPANVFLEIGGRDREEATNIDQQIEPQDNTLSSCFWINNDLLSIIKSLDGGLCLFDLIKKGG